MKKPIVAIIGAPNVGKSTFFNRMAGKKISIVDDIPGITRDRIFASTNWCGYDFIIVDTGGLDFSKSDEIYKNIFTQAQLAIDVADVIIFFVDGKTGLTHSDMEVADYLRKFKTPKIVAVNKLDNNETEKIYEFYQLGLGEPIGISAEQGKGTGDLLDEVVKNIQKVSSEDNSDGIKIAIVGKPNVGKSSLANLLLGENRTVVSSVAGTTRDAIDTPFKYNNKDYILIDTAGMRKKSRIEPSSIERYSIIRTLDAIERCDVAILVLDATEGLTDQDVKIAGLLHESQKPNVIVVNKWDLIEKDHKTMNEFIKKMDIDMAFMKYFVPLFISCKTSQRTGQVMEKVEYVYANSSRNITMGVFNSVLSNAISVTQPPFKNGRRLKITHGRQSGINPPTFLIFCNDASLAENSYMRYIENSFRNAFDFKGTPIKIIFLDNKE